MSASSTGRSLVNFIAQKYPANIVINETKDPNKITHISPVGSIPTLPAAAIGPGVGGTNVCDAYNPVAKETDGTITFVFDFLATALLNEDSMTKPESQNTGIETIQPIIDMDKDGNLSRVHFKTTSPMVTAASVYSKYLPMIVPKIISSPISFTIEPTPVVIVSVKL